MGRVLITAAALIVSPFPFIRGPDGQPRIPPGLTRRKADPVPGRSGCAITVWEYIIYLEGSPARTPNGCPI